MEEDPGSKDSIAIIGLGKVGTAVGYLLRSAGYPVVSVAGRSQDRLEEGLRYTGGRAYTDVAEAARQAKCVLITTGDDAIASVCETISKKEAIQKGKKVIHMSGAGGLELLASAARKGAFIASIHPIQSFAHIEGAIQSIPGSVFGVTAAGEIRDWCMGMVRDLGGHPVPVADEDKPLYHAAACLASNYLTTLIHTVERLYTSLGMERADALRAFLPLIKGTLGNIERYGTIQALTGPIARGDVGPLEKHLSALSLRFPDLVSLYNVMGRETVNLGLKKQTLTLEQAAKIMTLLEGEKEDGCEDHHRDNP